MRAQARHLLLLVFLWPGVAVGEESPKSTVDLGITVQDKSEAEQRLSAAGASLKTRKCVVVSSVDPHGPSAGILRADNAITTVAGVPTPDVAAFNAAIASLTPGTEVEIKGLYMAPGPDRKPEWKGGTVKVTAAAGVVGSATVTSRPGTAVAAPTADGSLQVGVPTSAATVQVAAPHAADPIDAALAEAAVQCPASGYTLTDEVKDALEFSTTAGERDDHGSQWTLDIHPGNTSREGRIPFWGIHGTAGRYAYAYSEGDRNESARLWNLATGRRLESEDRKVTEVFPPLAFSPDGKFLASTDGTLTRIWEITDKDSLRLYCSGNHAAKDLGSDRSTLSWMGGGYLHIWNVDVHRAPSVLLKFGERVLTEVPDPRVAAVEKGTELNTSSGNPAGIMVSHIYHLGHLDALQSCDLSSGRVTALVPKKHDLVPLVPAPDALRPTSLYCTNDSSRVLICLHDEDSKEKDTYIVIANPKTLTATGRIPLRPRDRIGAISRDDMLMAVIRENVTKTQKTTETQWSIVVYELSRGAPLVGFMLGEEFASIGRRGDSAAPPQLAFSDDGKLLYVGAVVSIRSSVDGREVEQEQLAVGTWQLSDGVRQRLLVRRADLKERDDYSHIGLALCEGGVAAISLSDRTHVTSIDKLLRTAVIIAEGHALVRKADYKTAYAKYVEAIKADQEWFFRDQYAPMLNVGVDALAAAGEEHQARVLLKVLATARMRIAPQTDAGKTFVEKLVAEARERNEQAVAKRREDFARLRAANKARHVPSGQMTKKEFVRHLDECKTHGMIGPPNTLLQFLDFSFVDAIGEPDQTMELGQDDTEWGFQCTDGWVWLKVTGNAAQGVIVVTGLELR